MAHGIEKTRTLILALKNKGVSEKTIKLICLYAQDIYDFAQRAMLLITAAKASYEITADKGLVQKVDGQLIEKIREEQVTIVQSLRIFIVTTGCDELDGINISEAFSEDLQSIRV